MRRSAASHCSTCEAHAYTYVGMYKWRRSSYVHVYKGKHDVESAENKWDKQLTATCEC